MALTNQSPNSIILHIFAPAARPTWGAGEGGGKRQLPQPGAGRQRLNVRLVHAQEDVFWLDVRVDNLAFRVQVI